MTGVVFAPPRSDEVWRSKIYNGEIIILSLTREMPALVEHTRRTAEDASAPLDPQRAHESLPVETCVEILTKLKPSYIHHKRGHSTRSWPVRLSAGPDLSGRAAAALRISPLLSHDRNRLCPPFT
jgi:hypothetical protein